MSAELLGLAERALAAASAASSSDQVQATVTRERSLASRFARSAPTQATGIDDTTVHVLVVHDGHAGTATTNALDDDALRAAGARARAAATAAAGDGGTGDHPGLAPPAPYAARDGYDAATAALDPAVAGAQLRAAFAVAADERLEAFGIWSSAVVETAIASSTGVRAADAVTDAFGKVVLRDAGGRSAYLSGTGVGVADVDLGALARRVVAKVPRGPLVDVPAGTLPVVLGEEAVATLLGYLGGMAFNGLAHVEERGALVDRLGTSVAAASVTLRDDPGAPATLPRAFDAEAVPKAPLTLLEAGVARHVVHDRRSAALAGTASTGHATVPGGSSWGAGPTNLVLDGGDAADEHALAAGIERGLYVHRLWYVNPVNPRETLLTGVTRDGTHLIEDGRITRPARDVRFTDTVLGLLSRVEALGASPRLVSEGEYYGRRFATGVLCPPLRASSFRITGGA